MTCRISHFQVRRPFQLNPLVSLLVDSHTWNGIDFVCLYNYEFWLSLCKIVRSSVILLLPLSYILNIKIIPLVTEYALRLNSWVEQVPPTRLILMRTSVTRGLILIFKIYD